MRITSPMITNRMLLNINRNARQVDKLYNQLSSGKSVVFPSDNPIQAARALKFRTSVYEAEQYQRNVSQGLSWMEITENAFKNVVNITSRIRELLVQGASDENSYDDRLKIAADIEQLVKQLGTEMDVSYAGRYVFSGYRTDQEPVFQKDQPDSVFEINQIFKSTNIETTDVLQYKKSSSGNYNESKLTSGVDILKLAYEGGITWSSANNGINLVSVDPVTGAQTVKSTPALVEVDSINDLALDSLNPDTVYFIKDSGNLVLGKNVAQQMRDNGWELTTNYDKSGFEKGDLNPAVYFDCVDYTGCVTETTTVSTVGFTSSMPMDSQYIRDILEKCDTNAFSAQWFFFADNSNNPYPDPLVTFADGLGTYMEQYYAGTSYGGTFNDFVAGMYDTNNEVTDADKAIFLEVLQGALELGFSTNTMDPPLVGASPTVTLDNNGCINIKFEFDTGDEGRFYYVTCAPANVEEEFGHGFLHNAFDVTSYGMESITKTTGDPIYYSMADQHIEYEFGTNSRIEINSLAKNVYTDKMYADLVDFCNTLNGLSTNTFESLVAAGMSEADAKEFLQEEQDLLRQMSQSRFNSLLGILDTHVANVTREHTDLGSRMSRLELIENRLEEDRVNYKKLLSDAEDVDYTETAMELNIAESIYQASLQVGAKILQLTLADYIR